MDEITLKLKSPITEEQWDDITDVDFEHTDRIWFHTKHDKDVEFVKVLRCKDCKHYQFADNRAFGMPVKMCKFFGFEDVDDNDFCSRAERREE